MLRMTNYGVWVDDDGTLNENEKAMLYIKECAESVGIDVIEGEMAFSIPFIAEIMRRLRGTDKLDSRELIAQMIENAPTIREIPTKIPISVFEKLISQEPKTGHWISVNTGKQSHTKDGMTVESVKCSECDEWLTASDEYACNGNYCPNCGAMMIESEET